MINHTTIWDRNETRPTSGSDVDTGQTILLTASIVIGTVGILGNGLVILICFRYPLQGITNIVVCNQSLIDFLSSLIFLLLYTLPDYQSNLPASPIAAAFVCLVWVSRYPLWALGVSSTVNLEYVTIERYFAVLHPLRHKIKFTPYRAKLCALIPWIYGLLHELPWALTHTATEFGTCSSRWQSDGLRFAIGIIAPLDHYVIPTLIICFAYTQIFFKLREARLNSPSSSSSQVRELKIKQASRNIIKTMFVVSITYLICWGPNEVLYFYSNMGGEVNFSGVLHYYTVVSALCNMCVNPIIYFFHWRDFRTKTFRLLGFNKCCKGSAKDGQVYIINSNRSESGV